MAFLLFFIAVVLSGIAAYYSVIGLIAIFSAAAIPVAVMGGSLEAAKLVIASWLYRYWKNIPFLMKAYFTSALIILMIITSMGIFGFLSKAHSDQSLVSGDVLASISVYDEKIKTAKDNIDANRKALKQLDEAVDQVMGRSTSEAGADKAVAIRKSQTNDRKRLLAEIQAEQKTIGQLSEERAPIAAEIRKVEAEVGPLKYIAALIYGDNPDENSLERSVRWLIILLIMVFDPLAVLMLIAANLTQITQRKQQEEKEEGNSPLSPSENLPATVTEHVEVEPTSTYEQVEEKEEVSLLDKHPYLTSGFSHFKNLTPMVAKRESNKEVNNDTQNEIISDQDILSLASKTPEQQETQADDPRLSESSIDTDSSMEAMGELTQTVVAELADVERPGDYLTEPVEVTEEPVGFTPSPVVETAIVAEKPKKTRKSKKKAELEQVQEDKSSSESIEDQVNTMIANDDTTGLESIYKQIVKELATKNRNKSTHWGPLKTKK